MSPAAPFLRFLLRQAALRREPLVGSFYAGMDLGTTNCAVTLLDEDRFLAAEFSAALETLEVDQEIVGLSGRTCVRSAFLPSFVAPDPEGSGWLVGQGAKEMRGLPGYERGRNLFYSFKSEMGIGREPFYPRAVSPEVDCPWKAAVQVLDRLRETVVAATGGRDCRRCVITVPASYQSSQRKDTLRAADRCGIAIGDDDLLDEPNAALLDYLLLPPDEPYVVARPGTVLVFDFGGGTCDVSIVRLAPAGEGGGLHLRNLAISRYDRIGGDDIDREIAARVLLPRLLEENGLTALDIPWSVKEQVVLPPLLAVAERLKIALCTRPDLRVSGKATHPPVTIAGRLEAPLTLSHPALTAEEFREVMEPFLETDLLYPRLTDFGKVTPAFSPVNDALARAGLGTEEVDAVLLVGGSSLVPSVRERVAETFPRARVLGYPTAGQAQLAVSRGAALHAYFKAVLGRPLLRPVAQERVGILTAEGGVRTLLPAGTELPHPRGGDFVEVSEFEVGGKGRDRVDIVVVADSPDKVLHHGELDLDEPRAADSPLLVQWRFDSNKVLEMRVALAEDPEIALPIRLENPLCPTANPSRNRQRIEELEDRLARAGPDGPLAPEAAGDIRELASCWVREGNDERALEQYRRYMACHGPDLWTLLDVAAIYDRLGDFRRAEKAHLAALEMDRGLGAASCNFSLFLWRRGRTADALERIREAVARDATCGAYHVIHGLVLSDLDRGEAGTEEVRRGAAMLDREGSLEDWERYWRMRAAKALGQPERLESLRSEAVRRMTENESGRRRWEDLPRLRGGS